MFIKKSLCVVLMLFLVSIAAAQDATPEATPPQAASDATVEATSEPTIEATAEVTAQAAPAPRFKVPGSYTVRQLVGGTLRRQYIVHVPAKYFETEAPVPLLLILHGAGGSGESMESFTGFDALSDKENFIVAYPDAINRAWNDGRGDEVSQIDDVGYLEHIIDSVAEKANIDLNRVYAAGYSRGGMMSYRLGCELSTKFAAIASVASTFPIYLLPQCKAAPPKAVMIIQGTDDPVIPWMGIDSAFLSAADSIAYLGKHNSCPSIGPITDSPDLDPADGTRLLTQEGLKCNQPVVLYGVFHGGHTWPGHPVDMGGFDAGLTSMDFDASTTIWEFFKAQSLRS